VFGRYMAFAGVTEAFIGFVTSLSSNPWIILLMILCAYIALGTVMDQLAILILTLPLTFPLISELGFDAVFFGILIAKTIEVGLVTPPLGLNVYVATGTIDEDVWVGFKGAVVFLPVDIAVILLIMQYPEILTLL